MDLILWMTILSGTLIALYAGHSQSKKKKH